MALIAAHLKAGVILVAVRPNEPSDFRGRKELLNRASALVTTCP